MLQVVLDVMIASSLEQSQGCWRNVELSHAMLLADIPISAEIGIRWRSLEHHCGHSKNQWRVDDVGVSSDPADITTAEEAVGIVDIEDIFACSRRTE